MTLTPRLGMTQLADGQAAPEARVNENDFILEAFANGCHFKSRANNPAEPGSPANGDCYLLTGTPTGTHWAGQGGKIAIFVNTAWVFKTAKEGFLAWVDDEDVVIAYNGASWVSAAGNPTESIIVACSDETTALTAGTGKVTFRMPYAFTLTAVRASLTTSQATNGAGGIFTVDINEAGTTIMAATKLTIDNTEKTSTTAATAAVISDAALADDAEITVDIDQVGDGTAKGLKIVLIGHR